MPGVESQKLVGAHNENQGGVPAHFLADGLQCIDGISGTRPVDFLCIDGDRQVKWFESKPEHVDSLFRRCRQQGFLPGVARRYQAQFVRLEKIAKIFTKLDMAYMNRIEAASQKNNASSSQVDSI